MRRIILEKSHTDVVTLGKLHINTHDVVHYRATGKTHRIGVLVYDHGSALATGSWGFVYHHKVIQLDSGELHFKAPSAGGAIKNALKANRAVKISNYNEFIQVLHDTFIETDGRAT